MSDRDGIRFLLPGAEGDSARSRAHGPASRDGAAQGHDLLIGVSVRHHFDLSAQQRAAGRQAITPPLADDDVVALEMEDGFVLYTSAGRLADDLRRLDPQAERDGMIRLDALRRRGPASRGLGDWVVRALSVLGIDEKWLIGKAAEKAREWGGEVLAQGVSWAGTKAIMWAIEQQLEREPGRLYAWREDAGDRLLAATPAAPGELRENEPLLVFIHGTGSSTRGSFGELKRTDAAREWLALRERFGRHIYGFEHCTFSQSPVENALQLARALPPRSRVFLATHSRGGLVGDLLCARDVEALAESSFRRMDPRLAQADAQDRRDLAELAQLLQDKRFTIERYLRVACPAQGTLLAGSHVDTFLSGLLHLIGLVPGLAGSPVYAVVKRVLLQIARNRTDPHLVPGIEAMLPDSPLTALLGRARPREEAHIGVVAGDIEGGGLLKRAGVFLTDHLLFEQENNDLVVDTASMFGGIARDVGRYVFDQGEDVSHFRYFANPRTRRALQAFLTEEKPGELRDFRPIRADRSAYQVMQRGAADVSGMRPVLLFLPGIMGSHLQEGDDRIWFDFIDLGFGKLPHLSWGRPDITPDGLFDMFYGDLCGFLSAGHDVVPFDYDWRRPLADTAQRLASAIEEALDKTEVSRVPVRLMTHSMGGLVTRALIAHHRATWDRFAARAGARWIMLGTPNRGSHGTVESLLGLSSTVRKLAMLHPPLGLQAVIDIVAGFPGAVQLLPRPGFRDTGDMRHDYYGPPFWAEFKQGNDSLWFGDDLGAIPAAALLDATKVAWDELDEELHGIDPEQVLYVAGYGCETPCGIEREEGGRRRLRMIGTLNGDGTVTHDSGLLDVLRRNQRVWYMSADHAGLTDTREHFAALAELLERGDTLRLPQVKPAVRGAETVFRYEPGPVLFPTEQELGRALIGGRRPVRRRARARHTLAVRCRAMDLRHAIHPILVGHYEGDAISGAEAQIDRYVVDNRLTLRHHIDAYAGPTNTVALVLDEPNAAQALAGIRRGAIIVGLGSYGELKASALAAAVRQGVLHYLLHLHDGSANRDQPRAVGITSLLLGYNSTTHISIEDSVTIVIRAVMEANREFADASGSPLHVGQIEFVEIFEDVAVSAAQVVRDVGGRLAAEAERLGFRLDAGQTLHCGDGMRTRLQALSSSFAYWPRLIVRGVEDRPAALGPGPARSLHYVFLSARARAEAVEQQRQPGLAESLIDKSVAFAGYRRDLARSLFHLLVPHELKDALRQNDRLVLVVDEVTANLPWEMLVADDEPLIRHTAFVRQFASVNFRHHVRTVRERRAYVIGNPSTAGYYRAFPRAGDLEGEAAGVKPDRPPIDALPDLPGAAAEARAVADLLSGLGYQVTESPPGSEGLDVINRLYEKPYRIVHVSAHGVFEAGQGETRRTGVVLSDGLLLTAAEIRALETVPDLVFLNCCHTGRIGPESSYNRLAYSVARELIECGVRCVVVAGWAVNDEAARHFAEVFYANFLRERQTYGRAIHEARLSTFESYPDSNTWGAFQAYGEPGFVMDPESLPIGGADDFRPVTPQEVAARIDLMRGELAYNRTRGKSGDRELRKAIDSLLRRGGAAAWALEPEVLYALGRLYADAGDFEGARQSYVSALALEDRRGRVPLLAVQQLANMEVRTGVKRMQAGDASGEALVRSGLDRLLALAQVAGGAGPPPAPVNAERCALIGSAYKRFAAVLPRWSDPAAPAQPGGMREALMQSRDWYARGQGDPTRPDFNAYNTQNRIALDALLGTAVPQDAEIAVAAGEAAARLYEHTRDYFDLIMSADGRLIAALVDGTLQKARAGQAIEAIVQRYRDMRDKLPETERWLDSVVSQIRLLAFFHDARSRHGGPANVAVRLKRIADAVEGIAPERDGEEPPPAEGGAASREEPEAAAAPLPQALPDNHAAPETARRRRRTKRRT